METPDYSAIESALNLLLKDFVIRTTGLSRANRLTVLSEFARAILELHFPPEALDGAIETLYETLKGSDEPLQ